MVAELGQVKNPGDLAIKYPGNSPADQEHARLMLTARESARACGLSLRTWRRFDSAGKVPAAVKFGRSKRWPAEVLKAWVNAGCPDRRRWETTQSSG